jgi:hypothetical protein
MDALKLFCHQLLTKTTPNPTIQNIQTIDSTNAQAYLTLILNILNDMGYHTEPTSDQLIAFVTIEITIILLFNIQQPPRNTFECEVITDTLIEKLQDVYPYTITHSIQFFEQDDIKLASD